MNCSVVNTVLGFNLTLDVNDTIAKLLLRDRLFEAPESELVTRILRPNDTCVDAGCQVGYYTCLLAQLVGERGQVYSFDANPEACEITRSNLALNNLRCAEVVHAALTDREGEVPFRISSDDQTGLSSLGPIDECKKIITVPCLRLETFLKERQVEHIRLLKLDVEGSEEMVLEGLGHFLTDHRVDFILAECYDERLRLVNSSTDRVSAILHNAGYIAWEYGACTGWLRATEVRRRADCNYLFVSRSLPESVPRVSIAGALIAAQKAVAATQAETAALRQSLEESRDRNGELRDLLNASDQEVRRLRDENRNAKQLLQTVQTSAGWRLLNRWRRIRNIVAPEGTVRRRLYDAFLGVSRG